jgi:ferritin-like metal-binding protein YciE
MAQGNTDRVEYFTHRQIARYGELTPWCLGWISNQVNSLLRQWAQEEKEFNSHLSYI